MGVMKYHNSFLGRIMYSTTCASKAILSKICYIKSMQLLQIALKLSTLTITLRNFAVFIYWEQLDLLKCRCRCKYLNFSYSEFSCSLCNSFSNWEHKLNFYFTFSSEVKGLKTPNCWLISCTAIICTVWRCSNEFSHTLFSNLHKA